jgi:N-acetylmuramic acid 6-phosphate (MurNAc-6-P) etherase
VSGRERFPTEQPTPRSPDSALLTTGEASDVMNAEDATVAATVARARAEIVRAV